MKAIDNSGLLHICASCCVSGFAPAATYAYDAEGEVITVTDTSDFPAGDDLKIIHVRVYDFNGKCVYASITGAGLNTEADVSALDATGGFNILVTIVSNNRLVADASMYHVGATAPASGSVRYTNSNTAC